MTKRANAEPARKADGSWGSFQLTEHEASQIGAELVDYFDPDDRPALALLALLKSFTYTRDHQHRENLLVAVEHGMMPQLGVANAAVTDAVRRGYLELTKKGDAR